MRMTALKVHQSRLCLVYKTYLEFFKTLTYVKYVFIVTFVCLYFHILFYFWFSGRCFHLYNPTFKVSAKCDDVKNFNTKSFTKKYSAGLTRSWQGCRDKCWALKTCEHWIWQKSGECEYMKFEVRRPDSNTYTGTCKKQDQ